MRKTITALLTSLFLSFSIPLFAEQSVQSGKVNVNQATVQQLNESLVGVGPKIAREIVNHRKSHGAFQSMEDLDKVKYIGSVLLEKNKDKIVFD
ncbi:ComEA family DNA-binding protein [Endozoicomonas euniceicola]|uniref:ComEA family DNA-binding protein n=1 Tax=Endozoicomonas euniceicola TaxID=1234143 RepID=A0ABY6GS96_9GAMM|nr:ComEA family DNA-binding protein [Endozoicomonas euniceicola]UYM15621.1 ComEA family DNA-binding protein [Endozoicomonas euniceicola]